MGPSLLGWHVLDPLALLGLPQAHVASSQTDGVILARVASFPVSLLPLRAGWVDTLHTAWASSVQTTSYVSTFTAGVLVHVFPLEFHFRSSLRGRLDIGMYRSGQLTIILSFLKAPEVRGFYFWCSSF